MWQDLQEKSIAKISKVMNYSGICSNHTFLRRNDLRVSLGAFSFSINGHFSPLFRLCRISIISPFPVNFVKLRRLFKKQALKELLSTTNTFHRPLG